VMIYGSWCLIDNHTYYIIDINIVEVLVLSNTR